MRRERLIYLALLLVTAAAYWPAAYCQFTNFDDWAYAGENPYVRQGLTLRSVNYAFHSLVLGNWNPVTWLSQMLDCQLFGLNPGAQHLMNVLYHVINTLLLFHLLRCLTRQLWPSALVAAFFALHPLHVESVAWISERKDVLSTFFGLLTLLMYVRYAQSVCKVGPRCARPDTHSVSLPDRQPSSAASVGTSCVSSGGAAAQPYPGMGPTRPSSVAVLRRVDSATFDYLLALLFFALGLMSKPMLVTWPFVLLLLDFWPLQRLSSVEPSARRSDAQSSRTSSRRRVLLEKVPFLVLSLAGSVITVIAQRLAGAIARTDQINLWVSLENALVSYVRYLAKTFWPHPLTVCYPYQLDWSEMEITGSAMILALVTAGVWRQRRRRPYLLFGWLWFLGTLVPVIGLLQVGAQSIADRYMYVPSIGLFLMIVWGARDLLGGWPGAPGRVGAAIAAAALSGCLLLTLAQVRYWKDGESLFRHAVEVTAHNSVAEYSLGDALVRAGKTAEGLRHLERAVQIDPKCVEALVKIADLWSRQGRIRESIDLYHEALRYHGNNVPALNNLAWLLATTEDPALRDGAEAVRLAEYVCQAMPYQGPDQIANDLDTLAAAYAEAGRYQDAVKAATNACAAALAMGQKETAAKIGRSLELYRAGKPLRQKIDPLKP